MFFLVLTAKLIGERETRETREARAEVSFATFIENIIQEPSSNVAGNVARPQQRQCNRIQLPPTDRYLLRNTSSGFDSMDSKVDTKDSRMEMCLGMRHGCSTGFTYNLTL